MSDKKIKDIEKLIHFDTPDTMVEPKIHIPFPIIRPESTLKPEIPISPEEIEHYATIKKNFGDPLSKKSLEELEEMPYPKSKLLGKAVGTETSSFSPVDTKTFLSKYTDEAGQALTKHLTPEELMKAGANSVVKSNLSKIGTGALKKAASVIPLVGPAAAVLISRDASAALPIPGMDSPEVGPASNTLERKFEDGRQITQEEFDELKRFSKLKQRLSK